MSVPTNAFHHLSIRKRIYGKKEPFPHPTKLGRIIDKMVYLSAIVLPLINLPQLYSIWTTKSVEGVSIISWVGFALFSMIWVFYGIIHKEKPIVFLNSGLFLTQLLIVISILHF